MARPRRDSSPRPEQVVEQALNQTQPGFEEHRRRCVRFNASYDVWRGNASEPPRGRNDWRSRLRVKVAMQTIDQALVNTVQGAPFAKVTARRAEDEPKAVVLKKALDYWADLDHLEEQETIVNQFALIYGVSAGKTHWRYCRSDQTRFVPVVDQMGFTRYEPQRVEVIEDDRPSFEPWDPYAIWWDPLARTVDDASYIVLESWKTRDELEKERYNDRDGTGRWRNLDHLFGGGEGMGPPDTTAQNRMLQLPQGAYRSRFRIWEMWRRTAQGIRLTVIGNQTTLLWDGPSPYWMTKYPVTISNSRPDLFRIEGISESELADHLQQALWTVQNLRMEQLKATVMRPMSIRATAPDTDAIVMRPNARWLVNDHDDVQFHSMPPLPPEAYQEDQSILGYLQYVTGINPYVSGASGNLSGVDQDTATGVSLLTESASRLLQFKARIINQRTWTRMFQQWTALAQQYVRSPIQVRVLGPGDEVIWQTVGPGEVNGEFDVKVEAGDESASRSQERADVLALANALAPYVQMQVVDPRALVERIGRAFNVPDPERLLAPPPQAPPPAAPNGGVLNGGGTPAQLGTGLAGLPMLAPHPPQSILSGNQ